ncbi:MAG TPA: hypothetical protein EYN66_22280 [Myxococcales bacterium]|nr:hypothetical protein [Myxococcales bacterium]
MPLVIAVFAWGCVSQKITEIPIADVVDISQLSDELSSGNDLFADSETEAPQDSSGPALKLFGLDCSANAECEGQLCLPLGQKGEMLCSKLCALTCPEGHECVAIHNPEQDGEFMGCVPIGGFNCRQCDTDGDCLVENAFCVLGEAGKFCATDCSSTSGQCEDGYLCKPEGDQVVCLPQNGTCSCMGGVLGRTPVAGRREGCERSNEHGSCQGERLCVGSSGWGDCDAPVPASESCDGLDNNCNGDIDEGILDTICVEKNEHGECQGPMLCKGTAGWLCMAAIPSSQGCN